VVGGRGEGGGGGVVWGQKWGCGVFTQDWLTSPMHTGLYV